MRLWFVLRATGLAATLGLIKDKGMLKDKTQWAGRNNDKKPVALIGLEDVYTGEEVTHGVRQDSYSHDIVVVFMHTGV